MSKEQLFNLIEENCYMNGHDYVLIITQNKYFSYYECKLCGNREEISDVERIKLKLPLTRN